jgi:hypothetical protein
MELGDHRWYPEQVGGRTGRRRVERRVTRGSAAGATLPTCPLSPSLPALYPPPPAVHAGAHQRHGGGSRRGRVQRGVAEAVHLVRHRGALRAGGPGGPGGAHGQGSGPRHAPCNTAPARLPLCSSPAPGLARQPCPPSALSAPSCPACPPPGAAQLGRQPPLRQHRRLPGPALRRPGLRARPQGRGCAGIAGGRAGGCMGGQEGGRAPRHAFPAAGEAWVWGGGGAAGAQHAPHGAASPRSLPPRLSTCSPASPRPHPDTAPPRTRPFPAARRPWTTRLSACTTSTSARRRCSGPRASSPEPVAQS